MRSPPIAFNKRWRAGSRRMRTCVAGVLSHILKGERRKRQRSQKGAKQFAKAIEILVCNFGAVSLAAPESCLQVPASRRNSRTMCNALDQMHAQELINLERDKRAFVSRRPQRYSIATATPLLKQFLPRSHSWRDLRFTYGQGAALLELRGEKAQDTRAQKVRWQHTSETRRMSEEMQQVNDYLREVPVSFANKEAWTLSDRHGFLRRIFTAQHSRCVRIFNNGTFAHGGRLYGGWWLGMKKTDRASQILIGGEHVAHCDFTTMHLRLAYAYISAAWPFSQHDDAYIAGDYGTRDAWKACTNALLNNQGSLAQFPASSKINFRKAFEGRTPTVAYAAIRRKHRPLDEANAFGSGLGHVLTRTESDLLIAILLRLDAAKISALPIHDCLLVSAREARGVANLMKATARGLLKCHLPINIQDTIKTLQQVAGK